MRTILFIAWLVIASYSFGQTPLPKNITISGVVVDSILQQPVEFATVSFRNDSTLVGTTTNKKGVFTFELLSGSYTIKIEFLSYKPVVLKRLLASDMDLGTILLVPSSEELGEIEIIAQKDLMESYVDKKVYNASKDIANFGGNALDVLDHTPAVRVDSDGTITLRGSSATVLIDGKPVLGLESGTDVLSSIPSNTIDKVEIITRSAKYSAAGGGGILNIITKKRKGEGLSGSFDAHAGLPENNGFSSFLNENTDKINLYSTISFNNGKRIKRTYIDQTYFDNQQNKTGAFDEFMRDDQQKNSFLFNIGSDFYLSAKSTLTSSILIHTNNKNYSTGIQLNDYDSATMPIQNASRNINDSDDVSKIEGLLNYTTKFDDKGHELSLDFTYDNTVAENDADIHESISFPSEMNSFQQVLKDQDLDNFLFQADYKLPLNETKVIELGHKTTLQHYRNTFKAHEFDTSILDFIPIGGYDGTINYNEKVFAFYGLLNANHEKLSYSIGLRTEISDITIKDTNEPEVHKQYTDLFPSATFGYGFENGSYISVNYSRSIVRPIVSQINSFISLNDQRYQSVGNPDLNPYYQDYFELLYDFGLEKLYLVSSVFINNSKNQFQTVIQNTGTNEQGLETFERMPINSGDKNIIGWDLDLIYKPFDWLRFNAYISPYRLTLKNTLNNLYDYDTTVLYGEGSLLFSLNNGLRIQISDIYQSAIKNGLTELKPINFVSATISKDLFDKKATLALKGNDLFNSKWHKYKSLEADTETYRKVRFDRQFTISFTYRFNQKRRSIKDRSSELSKDTLEDKQDEKM